MLFTSCFLLLQTFERTAFLQGPTAVVGPCLASLPVLLGQPLAPKPLVNVAEIYTLLADISNPCLRAESWIGARRTVSVPVYDRTKQSIRHHRHPVQRRVVLVVNMYFVLPDSQSPRAVSKRNKGDSTSSWMLASNRTLHIFIICSWKGVKKHENVVSRNSSVRRHFNFAIECQVHNIKIRV